MVEREMHGVVRELVEVFGAETVAHMAGTRNQQSPLYWYSGQLGMNINEQERIHFAYGIWIQLKDVHGEEVARGWMTSEHLLLHMTPAAAIGFGRERDVETIASAFMESPPPGPEGRPHYRIPVIMDLLRLEWEGSPDRSFREILADVYERAGEEADDLDVLHTLEERAYAEKAPPGPGVYSLKPWVARTFPSSSKVRELQRTGYAGESDELLALLREEYKCRPPGPGMIPMILELMKEVRRSGSDERADGAFIQLLRFRPREEGK